MQAMAHEERVARMLAGMADESVIAVRKMLVDAEVLTPAVAEVYDARLRRRAKKAKGRKRK